LTPYTSTAAADSFGAHPVAYGNDTYFKPWFFNGSTVFWRDAQLDRNTALSIAARMAAHA